MGGYDEPIHWTLCISTNFDRSLEKLERFEHEDEARDALAVVTRYWASQGYTLEKLTLDGATLCKTPGEHNDGDEIIITLTEDNDER
jgi:hypothetical protein